MTKAVTIRGRDFWPTIRVSYGNSDRSDVQTTFVARLGGVELQDVRWVDSKTLTAVVPATLGRGAHDLTVIDPQGRSGSAPAAFSVVGCLVDGDCIDACHAVAVCQGDGCVHGATDCTLCSDGEPCADGDLCTLDDTCQGGICTGANPVVCTPLDPCHDAGTCNPADGRCPDPVRPLVCGDSAVCGIEVCDDGTNDGSPGHCGRDCLAGPPAALSFVTQPADSVAGLALVPAVAVAVVDGAGRRVRGATASIGLTLDTDPTSGLATLSGGGPLAAVDGVATFAALAIDAAGAGYRLAAMAPTLTPAVSAPFAITSADPWPAALAAWSYRKKITVPGRLPVTVLTDFPVLISLVDADLRDRALASGFDLAFATAAGARLEHQVERYDSGTGALVAWVKLPTLDTSVATVCYLYFGQPAASVDPSATTVWSNGFLGVWHLDEAGTGQSGEFVDASGHGNSGSGGGGVRSATPSRVVARIGGGQDLDGVDDFVETAPRLLDGRTGLSVTLWALVRRSDNTDKPGLVGQNDALELGFFWPDRINLWTPGITTICPGKTIASLCTPDYSLGNWFLLAVSWDGAEAIMYVDGIEKHRVPLTVMGSSNYPFNIGGGGIFEPTGNSLDGMVDEVRLATTARSAEWFAIEHANQAAPDLFYAVGFAEPHP